MSIELRGAESVKGEVCYRAAGKKGAPAVALIHGASNDSRVYSAQLRGLSGECLVIAPDLPGHGRSEAAGLPSLEDYAAAVEAVLAAEGISAAVIGGHSMGGGVALEVYRRRPEAVRGLVFISTGAVLPVSPVVFELIEKDYDTFCGFLLKLAYGPSLPEALRKTALEELGLIDRAMVKNDFLVCDGFDFRAMLPDVGAPALVAANRGDKMVPAQLSRELADGIAGSELTVYEAEGHMPHMMNAEQLNRDIAAFVKLAFGRP